MVNIEEVRSGGESGKASGHVGKVDDVREIFQVILHLVLNFFNLLQLVCVLLKDEQTLMLMEVETGEVNSPRVSVQLEPAALAARAGNPST